MVLSKADAALEIGLLVLQEGEARPGLSLHIFLQMPGDHIDLFAVSGLSWCVLSPVSKAFSRQALAYSVCSCTGSGVFLNITSTGRQISL